MYKWMVKLSHRKKIFIYFLIRIFNIVLYLLYNVYICAILPMNII